MSSNSNQDDPSRYHRRLESQLEKLDQLTSQNAKNARRVIQRGLRDRWQASTARNHARNLRFLIQYGEQDDAFPNDADDWTEDHWNNIVDDVSFQRDVGSGQTRQYAYAARAYAEFSIDSVADKSEIDAPVIEHSPIDEDTVLSRGEVLRLVKSASHIRDKAMIAVMYEGGLRRGALVQLDIEHYTNRRNWGTLQVPDREGVKTAANRVKPISWSKGFLERWIDAHPEAENPEAPLFCSIRGRDEGNRLTTQAVYTQFKRIVERSKFDSDRVHPHLLRHSRATAMRASESHGKSDIEQVLDWSNGSAMHARYEHVDQLTEAERVAISMGVDVDEREASPLRKCPQCRTTVPPEAYRCPVCMLEFDTSAPDWFEIYKEAAPESDPLLQKWGDSATAAPKLHELNPVQMDRVFQMIAYGISLSPEAQGLLDLFIPDDFDVQAIDSDLVYEAKEIVMEIENQRERLKEQDTEYDIISDDLVEQIDRIDPDVPLRDE